MTLGQWFRRLLATSEEIEADALAARSRKEGCSCIGEVQDRGRVTVRGTVTSMSTTPRGWLEAELSDGTGVVLLIWMGRARLEAVMPGRHLRVTGCLARRDGRCVMFNPDYEVVSA